MFLRLFPSSTYLHRRFSTCLCIWDEEAKLGSGSYAFFAPGEHEQYQGVLGESYPQQKPRVFFAGEHLGINHASVQGAIQTALAATIDIMENS